MAASLKTAGRPLPPVLGPRRAMSLSSQISKERAASAPCCRTSNSSCGSGWVQVWLCMKANHMDSSCEPCSTGISATMPIRQSMTRIEGLEHRLKSVSDQSDTARRLKIMPGIGPITAMTIETMAQNMEGLRRGCDFAAWFG